MKKIFTTLCAVAITLCAAAQDNTDKWTKWQLGGFNGWGLDARVGYVIGGTTPLPLPAEIRSMESFKPQGGFMWGLDVTRRFTRRWGLKMGPHFFFQGMKVVATVKNYHMGITQGDDYVEGNYTGTDVTNARYFGVTIPLDVTFKLSPRWTIYAGPYISAVKPIFDGEVYDGYLREGDPTGPKIEIAHDTPATYDFSNDMRNLQAGVNLGFDWQAARHLKLFGLLDWGLTPAFQSDFKTIEFKMYHLYASFGLAYSL